MSGKRKQLIELNYPKRKVPESRGKTRSVPNTLSLSNDAVCYFPGFGSTSTCSGLVGSMTRLFGRLFACGSLSYGTCA